MARRSVRSLVLGLVLGAAALPGIAAGGDPAAAPGPGAEHRYTNRLIHSANPYLLLHAHNPVDWYPWGPEALERAKKEDKPIFLSVGYSTCYWCHVAEKLLYSDPAIAALMNRWFVNIKVDREERPDVDRIYMLATRLMTGHGGWPNNIFLTPDMKPFFAGSYFPPTDDPSGRPGFPTIIKAIRERWTTDRGRITGVATRAFQAMQQAQRPEGPQPAGPAPPAEWLARAREALSRGFDPDNAGFFRGNGPKFPQEPMLDLLLTDYRVNRTEDSLRMLRKALDAMAYGGIRDHLAGGFHRYSTEPTWSVPHFEKMLYDNAQLLRLYAETYQITRDPLYEAVALELSNYLNREMSAPEGGLYTAQDAEVNGEEGASYAWARSEIISVLGAQDAQRFFQVYDLTLMARPGGQAGMGDPVGVLRVRADLTKSRGNTTIQSLNALSALRARLLDARNRRPQPLRDDKIVVGLNGLAIEALVRSAKILGTARDLVAARSTAERIWAVAYDPGARRLSRQIFRGRAQTDAFLEDYALFGNGLMALYDATQEAHWRSRAAALADDLLRRFVRADGGLSTTPNEKDLLLPPQDDGDGVHPSGTSAAVALLLRLGTATGESRYATAAARVVASLDDELQRSPWGWSALVATVNSQTPEQQRFIASTGTAAGTPGSAPALTLPNTADHVRITASAATEGDHDEIVATLHIDEGWHVNANPASLDFLIPTTVTFAGPSPSDLAYPPSVRITPKFAPEGLDVYEGQARVVATFPRGTLTQSRDIRATIRTQACSDEVCLPEATFHVIVPPNPVPR